MTTELVTITPIEKLKDYGLNPQDWKVIKQAKNLIKIQNRKDSTFIMAGLWKRSHWDRLWLVSL